MASVNLDDKGYLWHQSYMREEHGCHIAWAEYRLALLARFGPAFESPMADFKRLYQKDSLDDYNDEFDTLQCKLHLNDEFAIQAYIEGLHKDCAHQVRLQ